MLAAALRSGALAAALRVDLCHSESATDSSGDLHDLPDTSGPVNPENFSGASLLDPLCDTFEFEEDSGSELVADIGVD